ncbi:hypothetical protein [Pedobacter jeongneungensis]|uniref:hypothetical protein n=1 Tax=Pedobacter jeongneungensis TaxID=947309 RepID=UPI0004691E51|nr:hypothetical protein [Pedobacter jeongneungensis]
MKKLEFEKIENLTGGKKAGQNTMDCISDVYSGHGWASVLAWGVSALTPAGFFAYASACAGANGFS